MKKVKFTIEIPEHCVVELEKAVYDYVFAVGGNYLDYHIFYDDSWLKDNDPHYRKLISDIAKMSRHINDYRNRCNH